MKKIALVVCCLSVAGCGDWSNTDLEFLNAMPQRQDMVAKLPGATSGALKGEGTRRDPLIDPVVGARSELYTGTKGATAGFNGHLDFLLKILDEVRKYPPTKRTADTRIWGPFPAGSEQPDFEAQVVIKKLDDSHFAYAFQHRPKGGEFFNTVEGVFEPTPVLRKGKGQLRVNAALAISKGFKADEGFAKLEKIDMGYITDAFPITVIMKFSNIPGESLSTLDYGYQENKDASGAMGFRATGLDPNALQVDTGSAWLASGAGYGVLTIVEGNWKGATQVDCWDAAFNIVYAKQTWPGGKEVGDPTKCVAVENGAPKP